MARVREIKMVTIFQASTDRRELADDAYSQQECKEEVDELAIHDRWPVGTALFYARLQNTRVLSGQNSDRAFGVPEDYLCVPFVRHCYKMK